MKRTDGIKVNITLTDDTVISCELIHMFELDGLWFVAFKDNDTNQIYLYERDLNTEEDFKIKEIEDDIIYESAKKKLNTLIMGQTMSSNAYETSNEINAWLKTYHLEQYMTSLSKKVKPAIGVEYIDHSYQVGHSRIGGYPDLPKNYPWPKNDGLIYDFIAQINLSEFTRYDEQNLLPKEGLLLFFVAIDDEATYSDGYSHQVVYINDVKHVTKNKTKRKRYKRLSVRPFKRFTLPELETLDIPFTEKEIERFYEMSYSDAGETQLLGHPDIIQDDPIFTIQENHPTEDDWMLLFQLDSITELGMEWIDMGHLYFYIRKTDLLQANFDKTIMLMQFS